MQISAIVRSHWELSWLTFWRESWMREPSRSLIELRLRLLAFARDEGHKCLNSENISLFAVESPMLYSVEKSEMSIFLTNWLFVRCINRRRSFRFNKEATWDESDNEDDVSSWFKLARCFGFWLSEKSSTQVSHNSRAVFLIICLSDWMCSIESLASVLPSY